MGHYAKVLEGKVINVIVAEEDFFNSFTDTSPGEWIKTSYNTRGGVHYDMATLTPSETQEKALRKNFAAVGFTYDAQRDAFIPPQPFPSWTLNDQTCLWEPPIPMPIPIDDKESYMWDEETQTWIKTRIEESKGE